MERPVRDVPETTHQHIKETVELPQNWVSAALAPPSGWSQDHQLCSRGAPGPGGSQCWGEEPTKVARPHKA